MKGNILEAKLPGAGQATDLLLKFTMPLFALDHLCVKMTLEIFFKYFFHVYKEILKKIIDINYRQLKNLKKTLRLKRLTVYTLHLIW